MCWNWFVSLNNVIFIGRDECWHSLGRSWFLFLLTELSLACFNLVLLGRYFTMVSDIIATNRLRLQCSSLDCDYSEKLGVFSERFFAHFQVFAVLLVICVWCVAFSLWFPVRLWFLVALRNDNSFCSSSSYLSFPCNFGSFMVPSCVKKL